MAEMSPKRTPSDLLRSELERIGWRVERAHDDLEWDQATALARSILHVESSAVRGHARFTQRIELLDPLLLLLVQFFHGGIRRGVVGQGLDRRLIDRLRPCAFRHASREIRLDEPIQIAVHDGGHLSHFITGPMVFDHLIGLEYI